MNIEICKWYNNAASPVLFFIDDFANVWIDINKNGKIDLEEDWGYAKDGETSSFRFLNNVILKDFPHIKTTFFVPVGIRSGMIKNSEFKTISKMINCDEETKAFFKSINDKEKFEIAYHGTTHGKVGETINDFVQEWRLFQSVNEAIDTVSYGKSVYKDVFGCYPKGGKYCGYSSNEFSDESIDKTDFLWWCRYCNCATADVFNTDIYDKYIYGEDNNIFTNNDIKTFGKNEVVDIPSTFDGSILTGVLKPNKKTLKGIMKIILKNYLVRKKLRQLDFFLENNLVISIQEHISPTRNDGRRQGPNIFDDRESLKAIFNYLSGKNIWYCTGTELAEYYILRNNMEFSSMNNDSFEVKYTGRRQLKNMILSIKLDKKNKAIIEPNGNKVYSDDGIYNIRIMEGLYNIMEVH